MIRPIFVLTIIWLFTIYYADAQGLKYISPLKPVQTGRSPGLKSKLISKLPKTYILVFAKGDEVLSGITEFAQKNHIQSAHFAAIGDAVSAKVGVYVKSLKCLSL